MNNILKGYRIKAESNMRCDFDHQIIEKGRFGWYIKEGKAQGLYHGPGCYEEALKTYEQVQKEEGIEDGDIEF